MTGTTDIMSVRNHPKAGNNPVLRLEFLEVVIQMVPQNLKFLLMELQ